MSATSQQWVLFGFDLRNLYRGFANAWKTVLLTPGSRLRNLLDEPVQLYYYADQVRAEKVIGRFSGATEAEAYLLPDNMVLTKAMNIPLLAGVSIDSVVELEVASSSPFSREDTAFGWRILSTTSSAALVALAIVSKSAVRAFTLSEDRAKEALATEIWAQVESAYVVVNGFGEVSRNQRYVYSLKKMSVIVVIGLLCLTGVFSVPVMYKYQEQKSLEVKYRQLQAQSVAVVKTRASLFAKNKTMALLNKLLADTPIPAMPLANVTQILSDNVWLSRYEQEGKLVKITGSAENASELMQQLSENASFGEVRALGSIRKIGRSGRERFQLSFVINETSESELP